MLRARIVAFAFAAAGCLGDRSDPLFLDAHAATNAPDDDEPRIVVENPTSQSVDLTVLEAPHLVVDARVVEGSLVLPFGETPIDLPPRHERLASQKNVELSMGEVHVYDYANNTERDGQPGGILRVGVGPAMLAIGAGKVLVRSVNGAAPFLEAERPQTVALIPADRSRTPCPSGTFGERPRGVGKTYSWPLSRDLVSVDEMIFEAGGCVRLRFEGFMKQPSEVRACLPDGVFPFEPDDALILGAPVIGTKHGGLRFENAKGASLELLHLEYTSRGGLDVGPVAISSDIDPRCATIDPECGDILVPSRLEVSLDGTVVPDVAFGSALVSPTDPAHTVYLLGAVSRPISVQSCTTRSKDVSVSAAEVFLAVVAR